MPEIAAFMCSLANPLASNGASRSVRAPGVCNSVTCVVTGGLPIVECVGCYLAWFRLLFFMVRLHLVCFSGLHASARGKQVVEWKEKHAIHDNEKVMARALL